VVGNAAGVFGDIAFVAAAIEVNDSAANAGGRLLRERGSVVVTTDRSRPVSSGAHDHDRQVSSRIVAMMNRASADSPFAVYVTEAGGDDRPQAISSALADGCWVTLLLAQ